MYFLQSFLSQSTDDSYGSAYQDRQNYVNLQNLIQKEPENFTVFMQIILYYIFLSNLIIILIIHAISIYLSKKEYKMYSLILAFNTKLHYSKYGNKRYAYMYIKRYSRVVVWNK